MDIAGTLAPIMSIHFLTALLSIILIDIVLAGDNAVVIAMAVQSLPRKQQTKGIVLGSLAAVLLRIFFTYFAAQMLNLPFIKLVGGMLILWIAVKLMIDTGREAKPGKNVTSVWSAVWIILIADLTMSLDNILAVAGASHGSISLLIFGFGLSIPLVVFASTMISKLMRKFPAIMWGGAAILGKVGGGMMITDGIVVKHLLAPHNLAVMKNGAQLANGYLVIGFEVATTVVVLLTAAALLRAKIRKGSR
jgi:YjbE family integral membrane protein